MEDELPDDAVLVAYQVSGAVHYYSNRTSLNFTAITPEEYTRLNTWLHTQHRSLYAALYPHEESILRQRMPGRWELVTQIRHTSIWRRIGWNESTSVFNCIGDQPELDFAGKRNPDGQKPAPAIGIKSIVLLP